MALTTTAGGLKRKTGAGKVGVLARVRKALAGDTGPDGVRTLIRQDRLRRRMTWPAYADFLGVRLSTLHKIATGVHRPSELTEAIIRDTLDANPVD